MGLRKTLRDGARIVLATTLTMWTLSASAADCPNRGTLDERYCDRDHDLVADLPMDPKLSLIHI